MFCGTYSPLFLFSNMMLKTTFVINNLKSNFLLLSIAAMMIAVNPAADAQELELLSSTQTGGQANRLEVFGGYVYLADGEFGLKIYDVSNPESPLLLAELDTPGYLENIFLLRLADIRRGRR